MLEFEDKGRHLSLHKPFGCTVRLPRFVVFATSEWVVTLSVSSEWNCLYK